MFTLREDETGRYYEITGVGTITPVLAGIVDTKAWCPRRATSLAHLLARVYLLLQAYATLRFRSRGRWRLKSGDL